MLIIECLRASRKILDRHPKSNMLRVQMKIVLAICCLFELDNKGMGHPVL